MLTVKSFLTSGELFQRVYFIPQSLRNKSYCIAPSYPSNSLLLSKYGDNECELEIYEEPDEVVMCSLIVYIEG